MPNLPSFRFPFASLGKLPPEAQAAHLATFNALTDIYQAIAQQKENSSTSTTTVNETVIGTSGTSSTAGVTSFNGDAGAVTFFSDLGLVNNQTGVTSYIVQDSDSGSTVILNDASAIAVGLNYTVGLPFYCWVANYGAGTATLTPSNVPSGVTSTISYPGNLAASSMPLASGLAAMVSFDGTNWWGILVPIGGGTGTVTAVTGVLPITSSGGTAPAIAINPATSTTLGSVKPDNTTITVSAGVISATGGGVTSLAAGNNVEVSASTGAITVSALAAGTTPTATPGPEAGSGATAAATGNSNAGTCSVTFGTGATGGVVLTVTFSTALASTPSVVIFPANSQAAGVGVAFVTAAASNFTIYVAGSGSSGTTATWNYIAVLA